MRAQLDIKKFIEQLVTGLRQRDRLQGEMKRCFEMFSRMCREAKKDGHRIVDIEVYREGRTVFILGVSQSGDAISYCTFDLAGKSKWNPQTQKVIEVTFWTLAELSNAGGLDNG
jgi:hypothetical protein